MQQGAVTPPGRFAHDPTMTQTCPPWVVQDPGGPLLEAAVAVRSTMDPALGAAIDTFRSDGSGALVLDGLPTGRLCPTPSTPTETADKDRTSELVLLAAASSLGEPVGYLPEHGGDLVQNILPVRAQAQRQISTSSRAELLFHTEAAFHPWRPVFLLLLCLRGDPAAATTLATVDDIVARLDERTLSTLAEARFRTRADESYVGHRNGSLGPAAPVLGWTPRPWLRFDADLMEGNDPRARAALETLGEVAGQVRRSIVLEAGQLLMIDNRSAVHGRTPFAPRFDGTDRWLQRAFVIEDLAAVPDRSGRIITTTFS